MWPGLNGFAIFTESKSDSYFLPNTLQERVCRRFPLNEDGPCHWCAYRQACRRNHVPTTEREAHTADTRDYRDLAAKTKSKKPTLALVRTAATDADAEEGS